MIQQDDCGGHLGRHLGLTFTQRPPETCELFINDHITKTCPYDLQYFFFRSKIDNFQRRIFDIFLIFALNIDCGYTLEPPRQGGSNEYPQSMFWSTNKKNRFTPAYPSFAI